MIQYTDIMINNNNKNNNKKENTMTIKNTLKTQTLQNFLLKGGKLQVLPAQKVKIKFVCNCQSKYVLSSRFAASSVQKNNRVLAA